jgi:dTDP-4-dehydrorhamnose reductase
MIKAFITGESGTMAMTIQALADQYDIKVVNSQLTENYYTQNKTHTSFKGKLPEVDFLLEGKLLELFEVAKRINAQPDVIIHAGAFVGTDFCCFDEKLAIRTNLDGTLNIVNICNKLNIPLVYFSTTAIYDPNDYSETKFITQHTNIKPRTLYGITKYAGELLVVNTCKTKHMVVRPVFGYENYPNDLHSMLVRMIYVMYKNIAENKPASLVILQDPKIKKSYTRVENINSKVLEATVNFMKGQNYPEPINIGIDGNNAVDWYTMSEIVASVFEEKRICSKETFLEVYKNKIIFKVEEDYCHYHNIDNTQLKDLNLVLEDEKFIGLKEGITKSLESVIANHEQEPYWLKLG